MVAQKLCCDTLLNLAIHVRLFSAQLACITGQKPYVCLSVCLPVQGGTNYNRYTVILHAQTYWLTLIINSKLGRSTTAVYYKNPMIEQNRIDQHVDSLTTSVFLSLTDGIVIVIIKRWINCEKMVWATIAGFSSRDRGGSGEVRFQKSEGLNETARGRRNQVGKIKLAIRRQKNCAMFAFLSFIEDKKMAISREHAPILAPVYRANACAHSMLPAGRYHTDVCKAPHTKLHQCLTVFAKRHNCPSHPHLMCKKISRETHSVPRTYRLKPVYCTRPWHITYRLSLWPIYF